MQRVWNDSCDEGIAIRSHVTGKVERFYLFNEQRDNEGDLQFFQFKPVDDKCAVRLVTVYND